MKKRNKICCLCVLIAASLGNSSHRAGYGAGNTPPHVSPFHDIFYLYYGEDAAQAKGILRRLQNDPGYKSEAYINTGVIQQIEKDYCSAAESYHKAVRNGSSLGYSYLLSLYSRLNDSRTLETLKLLDSTRPGPWVSYELALEYLRLGDTVAAVAALEQAAGHGFNSAVMIRREPLFDKIRNSTSFQKTVQKISNNRRFPSMAREFESIQNGSGDKGVITDRRLAGAGLLIRKRDYIGAAEKLKLLTGENPSFSDKSVALYWLARLKSLQGDVKSSGEYLTAYIDHLLSAEKDPTDYKKISGRIYGDIIANDAVLKEIYPGISARSHEAGPANSLK